MEALILVPKFILDTKLGTKLKDAFANLSS